jgi:competence protein ComEA
MSAQTSATRININTASAEQIATVMTGVGENKAKAIVQYRKSNGKFKSVQDLENVDGIGAKTVEKNKDRIAL